jgi:signal transduction histidine kinase
LTMVTEDKDISLLRFPKTHTWREWLPLIGFELAILASIFFVIWVAYDGLASEHKRRLSNQEVKDALAVYQADLQSYQHELTKTARDVESDLGQAVLWGNHNAADRMIDRIDQFSAWVQSKKQNVPTVKTYRSSDVDYVQGGILDYLLRAERVCDDLTETTKEIEGIYRPSAVMAEKVMLYERFRRSTAGLRDLSYEAKAQSDAIFVGDMNRTTNWQPWFVLRITGLLLLVVLFGWLAVLVYRRQMNAMGQELAASRSQLGRQEKLADKGRVAAELAHELRNPLTAINIRLHTLSEVLDENTEEHRDVRLVRKEIRRLNTILEDFLHLDRVPDPIMASVSSSFLLREVAELVAPLCQQVGVRLEWQDEAHETAQLDPNQIKQVMLNLIKNACESVDHDGTITLRARVASMPVRNKAVPSLVLEVEDNGPGIPPSVQKRLFEPFFSTKKEGTGLGLAITERIVQRHGGTIDFQSSPGQGTTFTVVLPLKGRT